MTQTPKILEFSKVSNNKHLVMQSIDEEGINVVDNKLLSPFTWSNINIKLPKLNKNLPNPVIVQQNKNSKIGKQKTKQNSSNKTKLQSINRTIDVNRSLNKKQTKSEQIQPSKTRYPKQPSQPINKSTNLPKMPETQLQNPESLKLYKRQLIAKYLQRTIHNEHSIEQKSQKRQTNTLSRLRSPLSSFSNQISPNTFLYTKMENYVYRALGKAGWCETGGKEGGVVPQLIWSNQYLDNTKIKYGQLHNHIFNSHYLTTKNNLHELQSMSGSEHYPQSFLMPNQYQNFCQQYQQNMVKICLKQIIRKGYQIIDSNPYKKLPNIGYILQQINKKPTINEDTVLSLKLCLYLQHYRKSHNYRYFQTSEQYIAIQTKLQQSVLVSLFRACFQYWQATVHGQDTANFHVQNIDHAVLNLLWNYHCMFLKFQKNYHNIGIRNAWIVKPIASSKGAGISLLKNSQQFLSTNLQRFQLANKNKYSNKIIQKYIEQPLLIQKIDHFAGRKFDIRQWVLITCDSESLQPLIYIFHDAYCRFSDLKFTFNHSRSQQCRTHITNYSQSLKQAPETSILPVSQLFLQQNPSLSHSYKSQMQKIAIQTILNAKQLKFQPNRFQLLGYDVIFDSSGKLWLLQINYNPACQAMRNGRLESMADQMIADLMVIVKAASGKMCVSKEDRAKNGWNLVYGTEKFKQADFQQQTQAQIKPFYSLSLGNDSLIEQVKRRNIMMSAISKIVTASNLRQIWQIIRTCQHKQIQNHENQPNITNEQQLQSTSQQKQKQKQKQE